MTYSEVAEVHRANTVAYLANHYGVGAEHVQYMGEVVPGEGPFYFICMNHRETFGVVDNPSPFIARSIHVKLTDEFVHTDKALNRRTVTLAGKCPECGNILMAEAAFNPF